MTMVVPDMLQICEIMLFSEGFAEARVLAKKMTVLYKLAQEQLSKQYHYDFGLRVSRPRQHCARHAHRSSPLILSLSLSLAFSLIYVTVVSVVCALAIGPVERRLSVFPPARAALACADSLSPSLRARRL